MNHTKLSSVLIGCHNIPILWAETKDYGEYSTDLPGPKITINRSLGPKAAAMTLVHELIHAIADQYGFSETEEQTKVLETAVCRFLMENPGVLQEILGGLSYVEPKTC
jgi:Zn-dependent peptidase ImmA (M78 family)